MSYIELDAGSDRTEILARIVARVQALIPGWELHPASVENLLLDPVTSEIAGVLDVVSEMGRAVFAEIGELRGIGRKPATFASGTSTWILSDTVGHTIEAGTQVTLEAPDGTRVGFETVEDVIVAPGSSSTAAGGVGLIALEAGSAGSGLSVDPQPELALAYVQSIVMVGETTGGSDAEDQDEYLSRLTDELRIPDRVLVAAENFEVAARNVAGVHRAVAADGYDPVANTLSNAGTISVFPVDEAGADVPASVKAALLSELQSRRLVNLVVHVVDPQRVVVNVTFSFTFFSGFDPAQVRSEAEAAVRDFLDPARWGLPPFGDRLEWRNKVSVRRWDVIAVLESVRGIDNVTDVQLNGSTADVPLTTSKPVGMPTVGTVVGSVVG